jgi:hypothetical protein
MNVISRSLDLVTAREGNVFCGQPQICFAVARRVGAQHAAPAEARASLTMGAYSPVQSAQASNSSGFFRGSAFLDQIDSNEVHRKARR